jgi:hypothetical protein
VAKKNGIEFVYNRCMLEEHERLFSKTWFWKTNYKNSCRNM